MALIYYLTQIQFEFGAIKLLRQECERVGISRPLAVTNQGVKAAGILQKALDVLPAMTVAVFDRTPSNPTEAAVRAATEVFHAKACDGLIAVPTTSGTGSEVARGAILILDDHRKLGFHCWHLMPKAAICDPELAFGLPARLTAATGMDAVAHCMETFIAPAFNPPADGIALDGLEPAWRLIERATRDGSDREARFNLMSASMLGAMAFQKGLGCVHSLSHSLGGVDPRLHHGTLNAMFLPAVVAFNGRAESVQKERRLERMAQAMGLASCADIPAAITDMNARLGLPTGLGAMGVQAARLAQIVNGALADHCHKTNPRTATADEYRALLDQAM